MRRSDQVVARRSQFVLEVGRLPRPRTSIRRLLAQSRNGARTCAVHAPAQGVVGGLLPAKRRNRAGEKAVTGSASRLAIPSSARIVPGTIRRTRQAVARRPQVPGRGRVASDPFELARKPQETIPSAAPYGTVQIGS